MDFWLFLVKPRYIGAYPLNYKNKLILVACSYTFPDLSFAAFFSPYPMHISIRIASGP